MLWVILLSTLLVGSYSNPAGQSVVLKDDGSYHFSFDTGDDAGSHSREEVRQPDGTVIGKYSYRDDTGSLRSVSYRAGRQGFVASGDVGTPGAPPGQVPAKVPEVPPEVPDKVPVSPAPVHENPVEVPVPSTTEPPVSSTLLPKENDDEEAHAPPVEPSEEDSPAPFPPPPFGKRRLGDEPVQPQEHDSPSPVDPSSYFYGFGHSQSPQQQFYSKTPGQVSFAHGSPAVQPTFGQGAPAVQPFYSPGIVRNPSHPFYGPGTVSGLTGHPFYAPGTSAPQAPVWNFIPQQEEQPAGKIDPQEHPGVFDVPPYWKRRLQDPTEPKDEEDDKIKDDAKEPAIENPPEKFNSGSPNYPTLIRTSYVPHAAPEDKQPAPTPVSKPKVVSRFFIYVPTNQGIPYWGYAGKGNEFKIQSAMPEKHAPAYSPNYWSYQQPHYMPHNQYSSPWNYIPQSYGAPQQQAPWTYFSRAIPVAPTAAKKSMAPSSYYPEQVRPAVQHYAYKGPSNTYGYFYQY